MCFRPPTPKKVVKCPQCGAENVPGLPKCKQCGAELPKITK